MFNPIKDQDLKVYIQSQGMILPRGFFKKFSKLASQPPHPSQMSTNTYSASERFLRHLLHPF